SSSSAAAGGSSPTGVPTRRRRASAIAIPTSTSSANEAQAADAPPRLFVLFGVRRFIVPSVRRPPGLGVPDDLPRPPARRRIVPIRDSVDFAAAGLGLHRRRARGRGP